MLRLVLFCVAFTLTNYSFASGDYVSKVDIPLSGGVATLRGENGDSQEMVVEFQVSPYTSHFPFRSGWRWGVEGGDPTTVITGLDIQLDAVQLFIPISVYCDLSNPRSATLRRVGKTYEITIAGGDAAGAYRATLKFNGKWIRSKKVAHGEFPDEAWEETTYSFNTGEE